MLISILISNFLDTTVHDMKQFMEEIENNVLFEHKFISYSKNQYNFFNDHRFIDDCFVTLALLRSYNVWQQ